MIRNFKLLRNIGDGCVLPRWSEAVPPRALQARIHQMARLDGRLFFRRMSKIVQDIFGECFDGRLIRTQELHIRGITPCKDRGF